MVRVGLTYLNVNPTFLYPFTLFELIHFVSFLLRCDQSHISVFGLEKHPVNWISYKHPKKRGNSTILGCVITLPRNPKLEAL